jgi:hypothetical protein
MEIYTTQRPWAPSAAARIPEAASRRASVASEHGFQKQAELILAPVSLSTTGITVSTVQDVPNPRMQGQDVRGVPPRGRPV